MLCWNCYAKTRALRRSTKQNKGKAYTDCVYSKTILAKMWTSPSSHSLLLVLTRARSTALVSIRRGVCSRIFLRRCELCVAILIHKCGASLLTVDRSSKTSNAAESRLLYTVVGSIGENIYIQKNSFRFWNQKKKSIVWVHAQGTRYKRTTSVQQYTAWFFVEA